MSLDWDKLVKSAERARENPLRWGIYLTTEQLIELIDEHQTLSEGIERR